MKKLIALGLFVNAALLAGRFWQELGADAAGGGAGGPEVANGDVNGDGERNISDASYLLNWLFLGGRPPVACAGGSTDLEERVAALEHAVRSCFPDADADGLPDCAETGGTDDSDADGFNDDADCAPFNAEINPGALEHCDDSLDNDCDGLVDANDPDCDRDQDQDGFPAADDCNDKNSMINPAAVEVCNAVDDNCDGQVDEGFDLQSDLTNCGACGNVCPDPGGACIRPICLNGQCALVSKDGAVCDDGNPNTINDFCIGGVCIGQ